HRWKLTIAHFNHKLRGRESDGDEPFVAIAFASAEFVVEMSNRQFPTMRGGEFMQHVEQHDGIDAAGHRHKDVFAFAKEISLANVFGDLLQHALMLGSAA